MNFIAAFDGHHLGVPLITLPKFPMEHNILLSLLQPKLSPYLKKVLS